MSARIDLLFSPECLSGALFNTIDVLRSANIVWRLRNPGSRSWPLYWRLIDASGATLPLPDWLATTLAVPGSEPEFPPEQTALFVPGLAMRSMPHLTHL